MRARCPGFTLLEMMVVVTICLGIMLMIVPIFQVSTRTVRTVEKKLAVYEAARNILDTIELEIRQAVFNEKGEHFVIKSTVWDDTDAFTVAGTSKKYGESRRNIDALNFMKRQPGSRTAVSAQWGGMWTPLAEPYGDADLWVGGLFSPVIFRNGALDWDVSSGYWVQRVNRATLLGEVLQNEGLFLFGPRTPAGFWDPYPTRYVVGNEPQLLLAPGREAQGTHTVGAFGQGNGAAVGQLYDLDIAYWDDVELKFKDPPDHTAVYFAPPPKALRVTITVCDANKRAQATFCRVVRIPVGSGQGVVLDSKDNDYLDPYPYNRTKDLKANDAGGNPMAPNIYP